jgi:hypothetical protein
MNGADFYEPLVDLVGGAGELVPAWTAIGGGFVCRDG